LPRDRVHSRPSVLAATPEEAAAIVAALERFMRATEPAHAAAAQPADSWRTAAILDGVSRDPRGDAVSLALGDPWINT
jgi:hypothetical protein